MRVLRKYWPLIITILSISCTSTLFFAYVYLYKPFWAQKLYQQTKARFLCKPPVITEPFEVKVEEFLGGLQFDKAVQLRQDRHHTAIWYVGEHQGKIFKVENGTKSLFLDLTDRVKFGPQWGLQGFALHPNFPNNPRIFVTYTAFPSSPDLELESRLSMFFGNQDAADPVSEVILLHNHQKHPWHPIAGLEFAPDGNLLVAWGEGPGTSPESLGGKLLRINVDEVTSSTPYTIPDDNPFRNRGYLPEVFASGFRNPWRFSIDHFTNEIWLGDVGQRDFEEVNLIQPGQHYGHPEFEGTLCMRETCEGLNTVPLASHPTSSFAAVLGGYVYRGKIAPLRNKYVYASVRGSLWAFDRTTGKTSQIIYQLPGIHSLHSLAIDHLGEIIYIAYPRLMQQQEGFARPTKMFKIVNVLPSASLESARNLSLLQLVCGKNSLKRTHMAYEIASPKWESGMQVQRYTRKAFEKKITVGQVRPFHREELFIREIYFAETPVETQMIAFNRGLWQTFAFAWDATGTDAKLVQEPATRNLPNGDIWLHQSPAQCQACHNDQHGWVLGYRFTQLDRPVQRHGKWVNQLDYWMEQGFIDVIPESVRINPFPDPTDVSVSIAQHARAYLDANCSFCHQHGGMAHHVGINLRRTSSLSAMGVCRKRGDLFFIKPKEPHKSLIISHMRDSTFPMPPDRLRVDQQGVCWVEDWIQSLSDCTDAASQQSPHTGMHSSGYPSVY